MRNKTEPSRQGALEIKHSYGPHLTRECWEAVGTLLIAEQSTIGDCDFLSLEGIRPWRLSYATVSAYMYSMHVNVLQDIRRFLFLVVTAV